MIEKIKNLFNNVLAKFNKSTPKAKIIFFLIFFTIICFFFLKTFFWISVLLVIVSLSKLIQLFFPFVIGFDWGSFATIFIAYHISPVLAFFAVSLASLAGSVLRGQTKIDKISLPLFGVAAVSLFFAVNPFGILNSLSFFAIAMIATLIYGLVNSLIATILMGGININMYTFIITLFINNICLVIYVAPYFVKTAGL